MEKINKRIKALLAASGMVWGIWLCLSLLCLLAQPIQQLVVSFSLYQEEYEPFSAGVYLLGIFLNTALFLVLFMLIKQRIDKDDATNAGGFGILLGIASFVIVFILPFVISTIQLKQWLTLYMAGGYEANTYVAMQALRGWMDMLSSVFPTVAIVLLICAHAMHWAKKAVTLPEG